MSERYASFGVEMQRGDGASSESFAAIAGISGFNAPELTVDTEDMTAHDSPEAFEEVVATIIRSGEPTFELRWDPAETTHQELVADLKSRTERNWKIVLVDADDTSIDFAAFITGFSPTGLDHDGSMGAEVTYKPTGPVTFGWES